MTDQHSGAGEPAGVAPARTSAEVTLGDRTVRLERLSGLKLTRSLAAMRAASKAIPPLIERWGTFQQDYARTHSLELDRATALMRYGPEPIIGQDGELILDEQGLPRMTAGRLSHLTDADWEARGNVLRIPVAPSTPEAVASILPDALELAEEHVFRLIGLLTMGNADVVRYWKSGELDQRIDDLVEELLEAPADDLLELVVTAAELIDEQMRRKAQSLGDRVGNVLRLFGLDPAALRVTPPSPTGPTTPGSSSSSSPSTSSTDSQASTDGPPTSSSEPPPTSSPASAPELELEPSSPPAATREEAPAPA